MFDGPSMGRVGPISPNSFIDLKLLPVESNIEMVCHILHCSAYRSF